MSTIIATPPEDAFASIRAVAREARPQAEIEIEIDSEVELERGIDIERDDPAPASASDVGTRIESESESETDPHPSLPPSDDTSRPATREVRLTPKVSLKDNDPGLEPERASFTSMGLSRETRAALKRAKYVTPSPIQAAFIPKALDGVDVIGQAKTGTGKTAAFAIPILEMLEAPGDPQAIVLAPTRELVQQIVEEFRKLAHGRDVSILAVYGGEPIERQLKVLQRGVDVVVGTPGRVLDHLSRRTLTLRGVYHVVLDEADRMLDIGFRPDIERILKKVPDPHQTLLLSATINEDVRRLANKFMHEPIELNLSKDEPSVETVSQYYISVEHERKLDLLIHLLKTERPRQCIVFTRTRRGADRLARHLSREYPGVETIHGDLPQSARNKVMKGFRDGSVPILVATDVVGRGIDVEGISHVVNYDIPDDPENYVHRIGRTGRMGKDGVSYTFVTPDEGGPLTAIELLINKPIPNVKIPGFEVSKRSSADPAKPTFRELFSNL